MAHDEGSSNEESFLGAFLTDDVIKTICAVNKIEYFFDVPTKCILLILAFYK